MVAAAINDKEKDIQKLQVEIDLREERIKELTATVDQLSSNAMY